MRTINLIALLIVFLSPQIQAKTIEVSSNSSVTSFYDDIEYLQCSQNEYSITELLANDSLIDSFEPVPFGVNIPFPTSAYWLHFRVHNVENIPIHQILALKNPNLNQLHFYQCYDNSIVDSIITGESVKFSERNVSHLDFLFQLSLKPLQTSDIYIYLYNDTDEIFAPICLSAPLEYITRESSSTHYRLLRTGILLFVIIGMLFLAIVTRTKQSVFFFLYVLSASVFLISMWGVSQQYIWPGVDFFSVRLNSLCVNLTVLFAQYFNRLFLNTPQNSKTADWIITSLIWASWISLATFFLPHSLVAIPHGLVYILATFAGLATPICGLLSIRYVRREAIYITLSALPIMVTIGLFILRFYGLVQSESLLYGFDTAFVVELMILMFGIVDQYRHNLVRSLEVSEKARVVQKAQSQELVRSNEILKRTIEEKEEMQKKLLQVHKLETIGKLAGGIAHDFNNLLTPIIGYTEMSLDSVDKDSELHADLKVILTSSQRAKELVNQILTFSKHFKEQVQYVSLISIVDEVTSLLKSIIPSTVILNHRYDEDEDPYVYADPTQIHQILMNLCTNSFHAIGDMQGKINIEHTIVDIDQQFILDNRLSLKVGTYVQLSVSDTGKGMDELTMSKVYDPFFTTKDTNNGTGLGLSVVHGIVKKLEGCISVSSKLNIGTNFNVYLPLSEVPASSAHKTEEPVVVGKGDLILVVDDDESVLRMMEKLLNRKKFKTVCFSNSNLALQYFQQEMHSISLVITDQTMPNMKGSELAVRIKQLKENQPIMLITGYSETVTTRNFNEFGIDSLMLKPIDANDLLKEVQRLIV